MARITIIGGGIAGLSAAHDLHREGCHEVTLLESSHRLGGKILTHYEQGMVVEGGPDSVFTTKPAAVGLMEELGMADGFEEPLGGGFSVLVGGKLHVVPRALASLMPAASTALESIGFLGAATRKRIRSETEVAKGNGGDETIASFFRRRFGTRFSKTLAEPLLAGIHAGSGETLSMRALYPTYIGLEQKYGSLSAVSHSPGTAAATAPTPPRKPGFLTLRKGMQELIDTLADRVQGIDLRLNYAAETIERAANDCLVIHGPDDIAADAVILSLPAFAASNVITSIAPDACEPLLQIRHASTAVVTFAFSASAFRHPLHGNGFLVAVDEPCEISGCTFSSLKWRDRAPAETVLMRCFIGQDGGVDIDGRTDTDLSDAALHALERILGVREAPMYSRVNRWTRAMPQYDLGHCAKMDRIEAAMGELPVFFAGCSYRGTGIPDCIRQGRDAARRAAEATQ